MKHNLHKFESFTEKKTRHAAIPYATINVLNAVTYTALYISLNTAASSFKKSTDDHVILYYNQKSKIIGIKFLKTPTIYSYSIKGQREHNTIIRSTAFIKKWGIPAHSKVRYKVEYDAEKHMVFIDLNNLISSPFNGSPQKSQ